jgi:hypothetical protein
MSYLRVPYQSKAHKAVSADETRPALCSALLRKVDGNWELLATNSYEAVVLRLTSHVDDRMEPTPGLISRKALKAIVKAGGAFHAADDVVQVLDETGVATGDLFARPKGDAAFPNIERVLATDAEPRARVAFSLTQLRMVAVALGTDTIELELREPLKPIHVRGQNDDHRALLMPLRTQRTEPEPPPVEKPKAKRKGGRK